MPTTSERSKRIGVFGGTFDPPHVGHLVTAVNVRAALDLDEVVLMVANLPWQKQGQRNISPAVDRLAMVQAAVSGVEGLSAGDTEIAHGGPSYTADTLAALKAGHPEATLFTIVGADAANGFNTWERHDEVAQLSQMVVVERPGARVDPPALSAGSEWIRVEVPHLDVSSTDLRSRVADGRPLDFLVPSAVLAVIEDRGLYRGDTP